jgi:tRNA threonylcarbamoyladenosine biosynthesis protein TsaE
MDLLSRHYHLRTQADTRHLGERLALAAKAGDVLCLSGDLGAGKSVLARAFIQQLCGQDTDVPSPTFTLMQYYDAPGFAIVHADLYRLESPEEIIEIGLEEQFEHAVTLIEWPQRMRQFLPVSRLDLELVILDETGREARLSAHGKAWEHRFAH